MTTMESSQSLPPCSEFDKTQVIVEEILIESGARRTLSHTNNDGNKSSDYFNHPQPPLGVRIAKGKSLVTLSNLLTEKEVNYLKQASLEAAAQQPTTNQNNDNKQQQQKQGPDRICVRMPTRAAASRHDLPDTDTLYDPLPATLSQLVEERILERAFHFIDEHLCPSVTQILFGHDENSILRLYQNDKLEWSIREPAVNVYYPPTGYFGMHKDNKALTILLPLTTRDQDFTGGGTGFWSCESHYRPIENVHAPSLVMAPKAGTAVLFGGQVYHNGLPIQSGHRVVFVASFSKRSPPKKSKTWLVSAR